MPPSRSIEPFFGELHVGLILINSAIFLLEPAALVPLKKRRGGTDKKNLSCTENLQYFRLTFRPEWSK
jgi:hypothetical protein